MAFKRLLLICMAAASFSAVFGVSLPAQATPSMTVGFVTGPDGLVRDAAQADAIAEHLAAHLPEPPQVRLFDDEAQLHQWLTRYREVDCAWFGDAFLARLPAGDVLPLAAAEGPSGNRLAGLFVSRQGIDAGRLQQLLAAMLAVDAAVQGDARLAGLGLARFVAVPQDVVVARVRGADSVPSPPAAPAEGPDVGPAAAVATAGPAPPREEPVSLAADRLDYDSEGQVLTAAGAVLLQRGDAALAADELLWQQTTRDAVAKGHVRLAEPSAELHGSSLQVNYATGTGLARDAQVLVPERNFHLAGAEVERLGEASYRVTDGRFTTCDGETPDWEFTARQVDVDLGRYAVARDVWFEAGGQPLLYLPYLLFPVKSERESGFLLPRAGYSSRKGAILSLAWYQVIDRHLDATVYLDTLSRLGLGKGLEYRYALGGDNLGEALYYHVSGIDDTPDSYALDWKHSGALPGGVRLTADVEYVSRKEFFEDFGETADQYNRDWTVSTVMLQRNWEKLNLTGYARYIKDLENDNDLTLQRLPELGLDVPLFRLDNAYPLYSRTELRATGFSREEGNEGERLFLRQSLGTVLKPGSWLEFSPEVALYGRVYHSDDGDEDDLIPEYSATLSTTLQRVFTAQSFGIERLRHSIEPQIRYVYIPGEDQADLPLFDLKDRIGPANRIEYALINRLTARYAGADNAPVYREVLNLRLSQAYDLREERDDGNPDPEPFSDLRTELTVRPAEQIELSVDALNNLYGGGFSRLSFDAGYADGYGNGGKLGYYYRSDESDFPATDYLKLRLETALLAPVYASFEERYDFRKESSLESVVGLEYRARCWSIFLSYRDRPDEQEFMIGFALSGLGRVGGFGSTLGPRGN